MRYNNNMLYMYTYTCPKNPTAYIYEYTYCTRTPYVLYILRASRGHVFVTRTFFWRGRALVCAEFEKRAASSSAEDANMRALQY